MNGYKNRYDKGSNARSKNTSMTLQLLLIGIITLLLCFGLTGCEEFHTSGNNERDKFVGTWLNTTCYPARIVFSPDGRCTYGSEPGTWQLQNSKVSIGLSESGVIHDYTYWFSNNNRTLLLAKTFGYSIVFTKQ